MGIRWDYVNQFLEVAQNKNIRTASQIVGLDHSNLTKHLSHLEEQVGALLFERTDTDRAKRTVLTPVGKRLYMHAKEFSDSVVAILDDALKGSKKVKTISIRTTPGLASGLLLNTIDEIANETSTISFRIETTYDLESPPTGSIMIAGDVALGGGFSKEFLVSIKHNLYASSEYVQNIGAPRTLEECQFHKFLILDNKGAGRAEHPNYLGPMINPFILSNNLEVLIELCRKGRGILELADIHPAISSLERISLDFDLPMVNIFLYLSNELLSDPEIRSFITMLKQNIACIKFQKKIRASQEYGCRLQNEDIQDEWYEPS